MKKFTVAVAVAMLVIGALPVQVFATTPPTASADPVTVLEDQTTTVTLSGTDPDAGDITSFDVTADPTKGVLSAFSAIDCDAGTCTQTATYEPDPDANGADSFQFTATDTGTETSSAADADITITPVNDAPNFTKGSDVSVAEDSGAKTVTGWASAITKGASNESGQTLTFHVLADDTSLFSVQPAISTSTGNLTFTTAANQSGNTDVDVTLTDNGGSLNSGEDTSATKVFTITVTSDNDPPVANSDNVTLDEDASTVNIDVLSNDTTAPDTGETLSVIGASTAGKGIAAIHAGGGSVDYTPNADANGSDSFTYTISDGDGGTDVATVFVTIDPVNDAPTFVKGANETDLEDSGPQSYTGWATAINEGASNESAQTVSFQISSNSNPDLFAAGPAVTAAGTLSYTPADDAVGVATVGVQAHDSGGVSNGGVDTSAEQTFTITITGVNDAPSFTKGANQADLEDAGAQAISDWAADISAGPADENSQDVSFQLTSDSNADLFAVEPAVAPDGTLTYTLAADANGAATIGIRAIDNGGTANGGDNTSDPQTFTITITPVNDTPSFVIDPLTHDPGSSEDAGPQTVNGWAASILAGPPDEAGQGLTFVVTANTNTGLFDPAGQPAVSATGNLTFKPAHNENGSADITVKLMDDGLTANGGQDTSPTQTFTITVSGVNDAPNAHNDVATVRLAGPTTISVLGNDDAGLDEPGDPIKITSVNEGSRGYVTVAADGLSLTYDPIGCSTGTDVFSYTIKDTGGTGLADTATVFVTIAAPTAYPVADGPRPGFVTGSTIGSSTPVRLTWCGATSGTTSKAYRLDQSRNGGAFTTVVSSTTATSSTRNLAVSTSYQFRTRYTDKKNRSAFGTGPKFRVIRTQDNTASIVYSSGWVKSSKGSPSGGTSHATTGKGKTATMTFTGRAFAIVGTIGKSRGSFNVYVDGVKVTSKAISTRATKTHEKRVLYARATANGTHTIRILTSGNGRVDLDAILTLIAG